MSVYWNIAKGNWDAVSLLMPEIGQNVHLLNIAADHINIASQFYLKHHLQLSGFSALDSVTNVGTLLNLSANIPNHELFQKHRELLSLWEGLSYKDVLSPSDENSVIHLYELLSPVFS